MCLIILLFEIIFVTGCITYSPPVSPSHAAPDFAIQVFECVKGGEYFREGASPPLFFLLPSPAMGTPHFYTKVLAGEGFTLKGSP
jgi:hypothetical protein